MYHVDHADRKPDEPVMYYFLEGLSERSSLLCLPTPSCRRIVSSSVEDCVLKWFGMDAIGQHPSLCIISTQPEFLLVIDFHCHCLADRPAVSDHSEPPVFSTIEHPLEGCVVAPPGQINMSLRHPLCRCLLSSAAAIDVVRLAA